MTTAVLDIKEWKNKCKYQYYMDPNEIPIPKQRLTKEGLRHKQSKFSELLTDNIDFTNDLLKKVKDIPFLLAVTDNEGYILKTYSDDSMKSRLDIMGISEGVQYNERDVGVNSISMSLLLQQPVHISGNEHFHYCLHNTSCLSVPIPLSNTTVGTLSIMTNMEHMDEDHSNILISTVNKANKIRITNEFYKDYYHDVFHYLCSLSRNKEIAEDLCQQTFLAVFNGIESFKQESSPKSWIYRIAYNTFVSWYRKEVKFTSINLEESIPHFAQTRYKEPEQYVQEKWQWLEIKEHMMMLNSNQQTVIHLRELEELSYQEIADFKGWSIQKVKTTLHRARKRLREIMDTKNYGRDC